MIEMETAVRRTNAKSAQFSCACAEPAGSNNGTWWRIGIGIFLALNSMSFALAVNISDNTPQERFLLQTVVLIATAVVAALLGKPLAASAWEGIRQRRVTLEALFVLSYIGAITASLVSYLRGEGPVFFEVASILLVVYSLGREVAQYSQRRVMQSLQSWQPQETMCELVGSDGLVTMVPASLIRPGQTIRVHPGRVVPVDGVVVEGLAFVQEAELTGEALAAAKQEGDTVHAGTHVWDATLVIRATSPGNERELDRITRALETLRHRPSRAQLLANQVMRWFVPVLMFVSAATFLFWFTHTGWQAALFNAMAVLLVACPCALGVSTPVAVWTGLGRLGASGFLVKDGVAVEHLASIDTVVFDKTGTLTLSEEQDVLVEMLPQSPVNSERLRALVAAAELSSDHPIAVALRRLDCTDAHWHAARLQILPGRGLEAIVRHGASGVEHLVRIVTAPSEPGISEKRLSVYIDEQLSAYLHLEEELVGGLSSTIDQLSRLGLVSILMTGDSAARAARLPIANQFSGLTPTQKEQQVKAMEKAGRKVLYVGDGINDAAAMAASTVSIAIESGSPLTLEAADLVWTRRRLSALPEAIATARATQRMIRSNLIVALSYNGVGIVLATLGLLHPVAATLLMTCSSLLVTFRALNLLESAPVIDQPGGAS